MEEKLRAINELLRKTGVRLSIEQRGDSLSLRGMFPNPEGLGRKRMRFPLGLKANQYNLGKARDEAIRVWGLLESGRFQWKDFMDGEEYAAAVIARFEKSIVDGGCSVQNLEEIRSKALKFIPNEILTTDLLVDTLEKTPPNTRSRRRKAQIFFRLAEFAGLPGAGVLLDMKGNYSAPGPRSIPSDDEIETALDGMKSPIWRALAWRLAIWGLRAHEAYMSSFGTESPFEVEVLDGKTGPRGPVLPLHLRWAEEKPWHDPVPNLNKRPHEPNGVFGERICRGFRRAGLPFTPHCLRHAWAIRASTTYRLPLPVSARMMGHSVDVHTKQYHRWLSADETRRVWEVAQQGVTAGER